MNWGALALLLALGFMPRAGLAQADPSTDSHVQDALVLGGGAARGIAHSGVLLGLERLGYDPDIVIGTSMGAIIGSFYAAGYSAAEIRVIMETTDWVDLFSPMARPLGPRRVPHRPLLRLKLGGERFDADEGLVPAWGVNRKLVRLLFRPGARARGDFDRLARRFRAVAADLGTGDAVVLGKGDLARAVRASMAVPGVFAPVQWNGRLLVDGAIAWYLPTPAAVVLGADHIIAADVIRPPPDIRAGGALDVGTRAFRLLLLNALPDSVRPDELILPPIAPDVSSAIFPRDPTMLIQAGLTATLREIEPAPATEPPRRRRLPPPPEKFSDLIVGAPDRALIPFVRDAFDDLAPGPYRSDAVLEAVDDLYATGLFEGVWPRVVPRGDVPRTAADRNTGPDAEPPILAVYANPRAPLALDGAAGWDNDRGFRGWAALDARINAAGPVMIGLSGAAGELNRGATLSVRRPWSAFPPLSWSAGGYVRDRQPRQFVGAELAGDRDVDRAGGWFGAELRGIDPDYMAAALLRVERVAVEGGGEGLSLGPFVRIGDPVPYSRVVGLPARFVAEMRFGDVDYGRVRATGSVGGRLGRLQFAVLAGITLTGGDAPPDARPALGDRHVVPGFRWGRRRGAAAAVAGLDVAYPIPLGGFARVRLRAGRAPRVTRLDAFTDPRDWIGGAGLGVLLPTPFGRITAGVGANTLDEWRFNVSIGAEP